MVISRARGGLKRKSIAIALRSCSPDLTASRRKAVALVEDETLAVEDHDLDEVEDFRDVGQLLEDHQLSLEAEPQETLQISDIAEALATSWRDKRQELNCLQKNRQFGKAQDVCRAYRIEVEELKRNTACHKCGKRGHWARECRSAPAKGQGKGNKSQAASFDNASTGAALVIVPSLIAAVEPLPSMLLDQVRMRCSLKTSGSDAEEIWSSPGFGVLDSGCGRAIVGSSAFTEFEKLWRQRGMNSARPIPFWQWGGRNQPHWCSHACASWSSPRCH